MHSCVCVRSSVHVCVRVCMRTLCVRGCVYVCMCASLPPPLTLLCSPASSPQKRRERLANHIRMLEKLVPRGPRNDASSVLESAIAFIKKLLKEVEVRGRGGGALRGLSRSPESAFVKKLLEEVEVRGHEPPRLHPPTLLPPPFPARSPCTWCRSMQCGTCRCPINRLDPFSSSPSTSFTTSNLFNPPSRICPLYLSLFLPLPPSLHGILLELGGSL